MANKLYLSALAPLLFFLVAFSVHPAHTQTLRSLAELDGHRCIGSSVSPEVLAEPAFVAILDREINCLWPGNVMKWGVVEPIRGKPNYAGGDTVVDHAQKHDMRVRGHTLVWHSQLPAWVEKGNFSAAELRTLVKDHIAEEAGRWKGKIFAWDVVNEVLNEDGTLRQSIFFNTLGKEYIAEAFKAAHEADPQAKLWINDYNVEGINPKSTGMLNLIKELQAAGVPIHGAGIQGHVTVGHLPLDLEQNMKRFTELGIDVAVTELDIAIHMPVTTPQLEQQAKDYGQVVKACLNVPRCVGVWMAGITDKHSWIPDFSHNVNGAALIYDEQYKEKPAYTAVKEALSKQTTTT